MQQSKPQADTELAQARKALEQGQIAQAEAICLQLLTEHPEYAPALHLGSLLLFRQGKVLGAIERMMHAIELDPTRADWLNDLGNLLAAHGQPDQAVRFFQHALLIDPENARIWNNLGSMREKLGETELAGEAYAQAVSLDDSLVEAWANYANWLTAQGREQDAAECVLRAFVAAPAEGQPLVMRGMALARLGRQQEAAACYQQHLALHPQDPTALHLYQACLRESVPARASNAYIEAKYDDYADTYDSHQASLGYRGAQIVAQAVATACGQGLRALDAGCGSGLVGALIKPQCVSLTGVDLSDKMLGLARNGGHYHQVEQAEIIDWLASHSAQYDLITVADLLIYFGDLTGFLQQAHHALRPGGRLVLTLEALQDSTQDFEIQPNGRFRHAEAYADSLLARMGFDQIDIIPETLRMEGGAELACWLVSARRP